MTSEETAVAAAYDAELLREYGARPCGDAQAHRDSARPTLQPHGDALDQSTGPLAAVTWDCTCGWKRTEPRRRT